jgi:hypothetical protein
MPDRRCAKRRLSFDKHSRQPILRVIAILNVYLKEKGKRR